jgi:hypothetical protein
LKEVSTRIQIYISDRKVQWTSLQNCQVSKCARIKIG